MSLITEIFVNGKSCKIEGDPNKRLLSVLRYDLDLTGSKYGCGEGQCGACTVLVDGVPKRSCILPLKSVDGKQITTIEGLQTNGGMHPLQTAFLQAGALQCGYCTPGMILSALGLLNKNPDPSEDEIVKYMEGNICRCGTYPRIITAVQNAARRMRKEDGR